MKLALPKELRNFQFRKLTWFELNDFDADLVFPSLFGLIVTGGSRHSPNKLVRKNGTAQPITPDDLIEGLSRHGTLQSFDSEAGRALLRDWVHTAIAKLGTRGQGRKGEVVQYVQPIHLATYAAGLPSTPGLRRDADLALYTALESHLRRRDDPAPLATLRTLFSDALGRGVDYGTGQDSFRPRVDGSEDLDITTLLTLCYLEQFETPSLQAGAAKKKTDEARSTPFLIPESMDLLAKELLGFVAAYRGQLPASTISHALVAQASLGLLRYFLQTVGSVGRLVAGTRGQEAVVEPSRLELYVDATGVRGGPSDQLARSTTNRDLASIGRFFGHVQRLRVLNLVVEGTKPQTGALVDQIGQQLDEFAHDSEVQADARHWIRQIRELNTAGETAPLTTAEFEGLIGHLKEAFDRLSLLLGMRGTNSGATNFVKWFRTSGGLTKHYGLLDGNLKGPKNWRYYLTDELLNVLVQQSFVVRPVTNYVEGSTAHLRTKISLQAFLDFLRDNYGILIDRPPRDSDDPETRRAAAENLEALKSRLRQMGYFQLLSDDFTAQYLRNPLVGAST